MKSIINKISRAVQVILLAPIKLPGKALNIIKYVAVGLGILESVLDNGKQESEIREQESEVQNGKSDKAIVGYIDAGEEIEEAGGEESNE
ncbi:hypothetical protein [Sphingobacterium pedocola]|uniref:Uncharacterized protein n=1 Tax=Sphingobacterium pedocola TaxID=2082722 RepID=A0ABR9T9F5_9SPHI|nr:hypothetical protein [Sphingobacterium pedocola]MBE8721930.1 hypothetical protein [Sphingobacterium pedocola]